MKPKLVVLNGSFNPPTLGHLELLRHAMKAVGAERGLFLPASDAYVQRKLARAGECVLFPAEKRMEMLRAMCKEDTSLGVTSVDINTDAPTTYDSLCKIAAAEPGYEIVFAIGADKIKTVPKWKKARKLLKEFKLVISSRADQSVEDLISNSKLAEEFNAAIIATFEADDSVADISSSKVRELFMSGGDFSTLVHPAVAKVIATFNPETFRPPVIPTWVELIQASKSQFESQAPAKRTCLVGGNFSLDFILQREYPEGFVIGKRNRFVEKQLKRGAGQTAGNVSCMLPYLGVDAYPLAHFDLSPEGKLIKIDLERYGANTAFVLNSAKGGTTLLACTRKLDQETGAPKIVYHGWSTVSAYQKHKAPRARDEAPAMLAALPFTPDVFFFDASDAGWRVMAEGLREKETLVYYEPQSERELRKASVAASDVIKFSGAKITDLSFCDQYPDKLFIQTRAEEGLLFKLKGGSWQKVEPIPNDKVVDCEGAGDWTSAQLIASFCKRNMLSMAAFSESAVRECLMESVQTASKSLSYLSSKGMIDAVTQPSEAL